MKFARYLIIYEDDHSVGDGPARACGRASPTKKAAALTTQTKETPARGCTMLGATNEGFEHQAGGDIHTRGQAR